MSGETASREELADALEEAAASSLEMRRSLVEGVTLDGVIDDEGAQMLVDDWQADLRRWYSVLRRTDKDIGEIPELERSGS